MSWLEWLGIGSTALLLLCIVLAWGTARARRRSPTPHDSARWTPLLPAPGDRGVVDGVLGIQHELPNGRRVRLAPLKFKHGLYFLQLQLAAEAGDPTALLRIVDELPGAVGLTDADLAGLTPADVVDLNRRFCSSRSLTATPPGATARGMMAASTMRTTEPVAGSASTN